MTITGLHSAVWHPANSSVQMHQAPNASGNDTCLFEIKFVVFFELLVLLFVHQHLVLLQQQLNWQWNGLWTCSLQRRPTTQNFQSKMHDFSQTITDWNAPIIKLEKALGKRRYLRQGKAIRQVASPSSLCQWFPHATFNAMVTKISKWSRIQDSCRIRPRIESPIVYAMPDIPSKFQKDASITFWVILLTDRQTNRQKPAKP